MNINKLHAGGIKRALSAQRKRKYPQQKPTLNPAFVLLSIGDGAHRIAHIGGVLQFILPGKYF